MPVQLQSSFAIVESQFAFSDTADTTEKAIEGSGTCYVYLDWDGIPGSQVRVGLTGIITVGANPITMRVRIGGIKPNASSITSSHGAVALEVTLAANTTHRLAHTGALVTKPTGTFRRSFAVITYQATAATSALSVGNAGIHLQGPELGLGAMVSHSINNIPVASWVFDFDMFDGATDLVFALSGQRDANSGGNHRVRVGGTWGADDGTILVDHPGNNDPSPVVGGVGVIAGDLVTVAKATLVGPQILKICSSGANHYRGSIIIREAA